MNTTPGTLQRDINEFLRQYRKAPHSTTGLPPAQLFLGRNLRARLDLVRPEVKQPTSVVSQENEKNPRRYFTPLQKVYFLSGNDRMDKWIPGSIVTRLGSLHYEIKYNGKMYKRHVDQIRAFGPDPVQRSSNEQARSVPEKPTTKSKHVHFYDAHANHSSLERATSTESTMQPTVPVIPQAPLVSPVFRQEPATPATNQGRTITPSQAPRRSARDRRPVRRFSPS